MDVHASAVTSREMSGVGVTGLCHGYDGKEIKFSGNWNGEMRLLQQENWK